MLSALKKQLRIQYMDGILLMCLAVGGSLAGMVLLTVIMHSDQGAESYVPLGTIFGMIMAVFYTVIMNLVQIQIYFNLEVSMGCTRSRFFVSFYMVSFMFNLIGVCLLTVISLADQALCSVMYPDCMNEIELTPYLLRWGILAAAAITMISGFLGALLMRFGKRAGWILWALWMFGCIVLPRITEAVSEAPDSVFGKIGSVLIHLIRMVPGDMWVCIVGVISLLGLGGAWILLRKQQVTS